MIKRKLHFKYIRGVIADGKDGQNCRKIFLICVFCAVRASPAVLLNVKNSMSSIFCQRHAIFSVPKFICEIFLRHFLASFLHFQVIL